MAEPTENQVVRPRMVKPQQMPSTQEGAHLILQPRMRLLQNTFEGGFANGIGASIRRLVTKDMRLPALTYDGDGLHPGDANAGELLARPRSTKPAGGLVEECHDGAV